MPDVAHLADLYAIGVIGAVSVNLGTCSTNFALDMKKWERGGMMTLAALLSFIWLTIAWEKPWAFVFAMSIMAVGLTGRWLVKHREQVRSWLLEPLGYPRELQPVPAALPGEPGAVPAGPAYAPSARIMMATRGNPRLLRFAFEQAQTRRAQLLVLFVRHLAIVPMGSADAADVEYDSEAQELFREARRLAEQTGVPVQLLYAVSSDVADAILDLAVTHGVETLLLGATQRGALWRTMKGDVLQQIARYLPERTELLIHA